MEQQGSHGEQERRPQGGGEGSSQEPAVVDQPEGDNLHLESVLGGHAAEDAFLQGCVNSRPQDTEVPGEEARIVLDAIVLLPAVGGVKGAYRAGEKDGGVGLHQNFSGRSSTLLQSCRDKEMKSFISKPDWTQQWLSSYLAVFLNNCSSKR